MSNGTEKAPTILLELDKPFNIDFAKLASGYVMIIDEDLYALRNIEEVEGNVQALSNQISMVIRKLAPDLSKTDTLRVQVIVGLGDTLAPSIEDKTAIEELVSLLSDIQPLLKGDKRRISDSILAAGKNNFLSNFISGRNRNISRKDVETLTDGSSKDLTANTAGKEDKVKVKKDGYTTSLEG